MLMSWHCQRCAKRTSSPEGIEWWGITSGGGYAVASQSERKLMNSPEIKTDRKTKPKCINNWKVCRLIGRTGTVDATSEAGTMLSALLETIRILWQPSSSSIRVDFMSTLRLFDRFEWSEARGALGDWWSPNADFTPSRYRIQIELKTEPNDG